MSDKKLIAVVGSTGHQGGSVLTYLLNSGRYRVRALTRDTNSTECSNLKTKWGSNIELWKCDMSIADEVMKAFTGCWGAYLMTDFYDSSVKDKEDLCGRILVDSAVETKLKYCVWSSLPNISTLSEGKLNVPMFSNKAMVEEYIRNTFTGRTIDTSFSFVYPGFYIQNFNMLPAMGLKIDNGTLVNEPLSINPTTKLPMLDINELGGFVLPMFDNWEKFKLAPVYAFNDWCTIPDFLSIVGGILGVKSRFIQCTHDEFYQRTQNLSFVHMLKWFNDFGYFGGMEVGNWRSIFKDLLPLDKAIKSIDWKTRIQRGVTQKGIGTQEKVGLGKGTTEERMRETVTSRQVE